jgi:hypothetical protein
VLIQAQLHLELPFGRRERPMTAFPAIAILVGPIKLGAMYMDESAIKLEMRIRAIECIISMLMTFHCLRVDPADPLGACSKTWKILADSARRSTFPEVDAVTSDMLSAEFESSLSRLIEMVSAEINLLLGHVEK